MPGTCPALNAVAFGADTNFVTDAIAFRQQDVAAAVSTRLAV